VPTGANVRRSLAWPVLAQRGENTAKRSADRDTDRGKECVSCGSGKNAANGNSEGDANGDRKVHVLSADPSLRLASPPQRTGLVITPRSGSRRGQVRRFLRRLRPRRDVDLRPDGIRVDAQRHPQPIF